MIDKPLAKAVIRKLRKNLDAVSKGPWAAGWSIDRLNSEVDPFYRFEPRGPQVGCARLGTPYYDKLAHQVMIDAEHIAQCCPENILALLDHIKELEYECRESMREMAILRAELDRRPRIKSARKQQHQPSPTENETRA